MAEKILHGRLSPESIISATIISVESAKYRPLSLLMMEKGRK